MSSSPPTWGPVRPSASARCAARPASLVPADTGFWSERRSANASALRRGLALLEAAGNLKNLRLAAAGATEGFVGRFQFQDSDVHKWLEAASWHLADHDDGDLRADVESVVSLIEDAQDADGYLQTYYQVQSPGLRWTELNWGHELYCHGHLIQAAVAHRRCLGTDQLLSVAVRLADHLVDTFLDDPPEPGFCGHPIIEGALVELYRETGAASYLQLAVTFVERRGSRTMQGGDRGGNPPTPDYWPDIVPVREQVEVSGHAVRQLYLLEGVTDLAVEIGDPNLLDRLERIWADMVATRTYITGGVGSRHDFERFGDAFELPPDRAYAETCAAIASMRWSWRLALATGRACYSDMVERTLFNAVLPGVSIAGDEYLYVNSLHVRSDHRDHGGDETLYRTPWFACACCPPNIMRTIASLGHLAASVSDVGLQVHQYIAGDVRGILDRGPVHLRISTGLPADGAVRLEVLESPGAWLLALRRPAWATSADVLVDDEQVEAVEEDGWLRLGREWHPGDTIEVTFGMAVRSVRANPRVDAVRGCIAIERGPLVYCLEDADVPDDGGPIDDLVVTGPAIESDIGPAGLPRLFVPASRRRETTSGWWPYTEVQMDESTGHVPMRRVVSVHLVPYLVWGNRGPGAMRVWLPTV